MTSNCFTCDRDCHAEYVITTYLIYLLKLILYCIRIINSILHSRLLICIVSWKKCRRTHLFKVPNYSKYPYYFWVGIEIYCVTQS